MITQEAFRDAVIDGIKRVKGVADVDIGNDEDFANAGLDSLDAMDLVLQVESITGLDFGEFDLSDANTIDAFYDKARQLMDQ